MLENWEIATGDRRPMCADTGLPCYYVRAGNEAVVEGGFIALERALRRATADATAPVPLRPKSPGKCACPAALLETRASRKYAPRAHVKCLGASPPQASTSTVRVSLSACNSAMVVKGYAVWCPGLPGCWSHGQTEEEALANIKDAIATYSTTGSGIVVSRGGHSPYVIHLTAEEREELEARGRRYTSPYRDVIRAKIILLAAQGLSNDVIAARLDTPRQVVSTWRQRFYLARLPGLEEQPRGGRPARFSPQPRRRAQGAGV